MYISCFGPFLSLQRRSLCSLFSSLSDNIHMMIDNSVARAISILDRLAKITCLVAGLQIDRVYFRSRILTSISLQLNVSEAETLVKLSESKPYQYLLKYRDGWTHDNMAFAICFQDDYVA